MMVEQLVHEAETYTCENLGRTILLAEKYQTSCDQPFPHSMYVDGRLARFYDYADYARFLPHTLTQ